MIFKEAILPIVVIAFNILTVLYIDKNGNPILQIILGPMVILTV